MKQGKEFYTTDDLRTTSWLGEVVDNVDPEYEGRIKVRVYGKFDDLEVDYIPWAFPSNNSTASSTTGGGYYSVPKVGSIVSIVFDNGNIYHPEYRFLQRVSDELKEEIKESQINFHSLIYDVDEKLKIFYTQDKGLMIDYDESSINIKPNNDIYIKNKNEDYIEIVSDGTMNIRLSIDANLTVDGNVNVNCTNATVTATDVAEIEGSQVKLGVAAAQAVIKGNIFQTLFNAHTHTGNLGVSTTPPIAPLTGTELSTKVVTE